MLNLWQIKFPIYKFASPNLIRQGPYTYCETNSGELLLIDDKSMPGSTLGLRRLQHEAACGVNAKQLYKLNKPIFTIAELLQTNHKTFLDSEGRLFNYTKKEFFHVHSYKLEKFVEFMEGYVLYPKGLHCRFFLARAPELDELYLQVLHVGMGFVLYNLASEHLPPFRRKI